jgi:hypothetical protein
LAALTALWQPNRCIGSTIRQCKRADRHDLIPPPNGVITECASLEARWQRQNLSKQFIRDEHRPIKTAGQRLQPEVFIEEPYKSLTRLAIFAVRLSDYWTRLGSLADKHPFTLVSKSTSLQEAAFKLLGIVCGRAPEPVRDCGRRSAARLESPAS